MIQNPRPWHPSQLSLSAVPVIKKFKKRTKIVAYAMSRSLQATIFQPSLYSTYIYTVRTHTQYARIHSTHAHTVCTHTQYARTHSTHAHTVRTHTQYARTHSTHAHTVRTHTQYVNTRYHSVTISCQRHPSTHDIFPPTGPLKPEAALACIGMCEDILIALGMAYRGTAATQNTHTMG